MSYWLIDIESFITVYSNNKPTKEEAKNYIKEYIEQFIANASVKIPRF